MDYTAEFLTRLLASGLEPDGLVADGCIHRCRTTDDRSGQLSGWYVLHLDGIPSGAYGDWRTGQQSTWCSKAELTPQEAAENRRRLDDARARRRDEIATKHATAAERARQAWRTAGPAKPDHPYLVSKGVPPLKLRQMDTTLLVPMSDGGRLVNLQRIWPDGTKRFMTGGRVTGCYYPVGDIGKRLYLCEGAATAHTIHRATGSGVFACLSAHNMATVALSVRARYPDADMVLAADHDPVGIGAAQKAAAMVGASITWPDTPGNDFNDELRVRADG